MIALPIPPPPKFAVFSVKKSRLIELIPLIATLAITSDQHGDGQQGRDPGADLHGAIDGVPAAQVAARGEQRVGVGGLAHAWLPLRLAIERCTNTRAIAVEDERQDEQDHRQIGERCGRRTRWRSQVLRGDLAGGRLGRQEEVGVDAGRPADHLGDGDRLADRAPEPEHDRAR